MCARPPQKRFRAQIQLPRSRFCRPRTRAASCPHTSTGRVYLVTVVGQDCTIELLIRAVMASAQCHLRDERKISVSCRRGALLPAGWTQREIKHQLTHYYRTLSSSAGPRTGNQPRKRRFLVRLSRWRILPTIINDFKSSVWNDEGTSE
jgi:hypothetical protein